MGREYQRNVVVQSTVPNNSEPQVFDGIEGLLVWTNAGSSNATAAVTKDTTKAFEGSASLLLDTGATTPLTNDYVAAERSAVIGATRYIEVSGMMSQGQIWAAQQVNFSILIDRNGQAWDFRIRHTTVSSQVLYYNSSEVYTAASALSIAGGSGEWVFFRFVFDAKNGKYVSIQIGENVINMNNAQAFTQGSTSLSAVTINIELVTLAAVRKRVSIDNVTVRGLDSL